MFIFFEADYWSLGLVVHECITGVRPFLPGYPTVQWYRFQRLHFKKSLLLTSFLKGCSTLKRNHETIYAFMCDLPEN